MVCEMALAFVLLIGAGLMLRSFCSPSIHRSGLRSANLLTLQISVSGTKQGDPARRELYYREVNERISAVPGVSRSARLIMRRSPATFGHTISNRRPSRALPGEWPSAVYRVSWPRILRHNATPVSRGREFTTDDNLQSQRVLVINEAAAPSATGRTRMRSGSGLSPPGEPRTVVGIVRNVKQHDWQSTGGDLFPLLQSREYLQRDARHYEFISLVVRVDRDPRGALSMFVMQLNQSIQTCSSQTSLRWIAP